VSTRLAGWKTRKVDAPLEASTVTDAAFHRYAHGATDYIP